MPLAAAVHFVLQLVPVPLERGKAGRQGCGITPLQHHCCEECVEMGVRGPHLLWLFSLRLIFSQLSLP